MMNGNKEIVLQARGNNITKAIIVSEILKNNYIPVIKIHASKFAYVVM
jgi:DNA-binding protein Alba